MITFVYGAPGSGKTKYIFDSIAETSNKNSFLIVPEQETVTAERRSLTALPSSGSQLSLEVLNFTRLCNRVFREYGGLSYRYATKSMKALIMWRTLRELGPMLEVYGAEGNEYSLTDTMLSACGEFSSCIVSPGKLEAAAKALPEGALRSKLRDLSLIFASYTNLLGELCDDRSDDLDKLASLLESKKFFSGTDVYIDSFTSFTAQETEIISHVFRQADNVTVALSCDSPDCGLICCESVCHTAKKLEALAEKFGKPHERIYLTENFRAKNSELSRLPTEFWRSSSDLSDDIPESERGNIRVLHCGTPYDEAQAAVYAIETELRRGLRYRDIAVVARSASDYDGIIDTALASAGINYYMSKREDPASSPAVTFLLSSLKINFLGYRKEDVLTFIKTGLCGIEPRDADMFEEYINTWNVRGKRFLEPFNMNPDGYTSDWSSRGKRIFDAANRVRERLIELLGGFFDAFDAENSAVGKCRAVFGFFESSELAENIRKLAEYELERGNRRAASDTVAVWNILINMLDDIAAAFPDDDLDAEEFYRAVVLCIRTATVGSIPTGYDEVTVGSADLLRSSEVKCAIIIGANEGKFPAKVKERNILNDSERQVLSELGVTLSGNSRDNASEELLFARRALSLPSERLYVTYAETTATGSKQRPSMITVRLLNRYGYLGNGENFPADPLDNVWNVESARNILSELPKSGLSSALKSELQKKGVKAGGRISDNIEDLDKRTVREIFGKRLDMSQTAIEKYVKCKFAYYCDNVLKLRNEEKATVDSRIAGIFVHAVLEKFLPVFIGKDGINKNADSAAAIDSVIDMLIGRLRINELKNSNRLHHLFDNLRRLSLLLIESIKEEFDHSRFRPVMYELGIGKNGHIKPLEFTLNDGTVITLNGKIDRVDLFRENGKTYVRVVDYKTSSKKFDIEKISEGLDLQLLIYLFTLCSAKEGIKELFGSDSDLLPAGANYLSVTSSLKSGNRPVTEREAAELASEGIFRSGFCVGDEEIIGAYTGSAKPPKGIKPISGENLADIKDQLEKAVENIGRSIMTGAAMPDAGSYLERNPRASSPCEYCPYASICRVPEYR